MPIRVSFTNGNTFYAPTRVTQRAHASTNTWAFQLSTLLSSAAFERHISKHYRRLSWVGWLISKELLDGPSRIHDGSESIFPRRSQRFPSCFFRHDQNERASTASAALWGHGSWIHGFPKTFHLTLHVQSSLHLNSSTPLPPTVAGLTSWLLTVL